TVRALERRGIRPEAIRRYWVESGIKPIDIQFSWDTLYAMNRDIIDPESNRYFFVQDPVKFSIDGADRITGKAPLQPDHPEKGNREYCIDGAKTVFISAEDSETFKDAGKIRLKDLCNIDYGTPAKYSGTDVSILKKGFKAVQWVGEDSTEAKILMPDGTVMNGLVENAILKEKNDMVQFERIGFVRLETKDPKSFTAVFAHR
ncbi:MAG: glutamate--tRNA ligase, partial [Candidatus Methanomethylophilaceae archaeon]|nr:glutamate--tRNA ligase [Candidatus Methanomethylophilaceae archaeon]